MATQHSSTSTSPSPFSFTLPIPSEEARLLSPAIFDIEPSVFSGPRTPHQVTFPRYTAPTIPRDAWTLTPHLTPVALPRERPRLRISGTILVFDRAGQTQCPVTIHLDVDSAPFAHPIHTTEPPFRIGVWEMVDGCEEEVQLRAVDLFVHVAGRMHGSQPDESAELMQMWAQVLVGTLNGERMY